jgi:hypothetical protein
VSKKPRKVREPKAAYATKKPAAAPAVSQSKTASGVRYATPEQVKKAADEVFKVHAELFRKLAQ